MLVHRRVTLSIKFVSTTHLHNRLERGTLRLNCLTKEHNPMSPARARTGTSRSGGERTKHEGTANMTHPLRKALFLCEEKNISRWFAYPLTVQEKEKSYPKIAKLRQKGLLINLCHHCKYGRRKTHGNLYIFFRFRNMLVCTSMCRTPQYCYSRHSRHNHESRRHIRQQHL